MKKLIVNADDFGLTESVNRGIIYGFQKGIITSSSLMVYRLGAREAGKLAKRSPKLGVGLHFELVGFDKNFFEAIRKNSDMSLVKRIKIRMMTPQKIKEVEQNFYKQIEKFKELTGKLPDHIDSHYHIHKLSFILPFVMEYSRKYKIPLRGKEGINFLGNKFYGKPNIKKVSVENLIKILKNLPEGVSELMTHAAFSSDKLREISSYKDERQIELETLTSPEIKKVIKEEKIKLISWKDASLS